MDALFTPGNVLLSRRFSAATGALDPQHWDVPCGMVNYDWDAARSFALANCSNSGLNLLAAWFDGAAVRYKETANSMGFKPGKSLSAGGGSSSGIVTSFPNPVKSTLNLNGPVGSCAYKISDMTGRELQAGTSSAGGMIMVEQLPAGTYQLSIQECAGRSTTFRFSKL